MSNNHLWARPGDVICKRVGLYAISSTAKASFTAQIVNPTSLAPYGQAAEVAGGSKTKWPMAYNINAKALL